MSQGKPKIFSQRPIGSTW